MSYQWRNGLVTFKLYWSKKGNCPKVRLVDPDESATWDWEDCDAAQGMTQEVRQFKSLNDAAEYLGLC